MDRNNVYNSRLSRMIALASITIVDTLNCKLFQEQLWHNFKINLKKAIDFLSLKMIYYFDKLKVNMYGLAPTLLITQVIYRQKLSLDNAIMLTTVLGKD